MAHKADIKEAMTSTNWKKWEIQIMSLHLRKEEMIHSTRQMHGNLANVACLEYVILRFLIRQMRFLWRRCWSLMQAGWNSTREFVSSKIPLNSCWAHLGESSLSLNSLGQVRFLCIGFCMISILLIQVLTCRLPSPSSKRRKGRLEMKRRNWNPSSSLFLFFFWLLPCTSSLVSKS